MTLTERIIPVLTAVFFLIPGAFTMAVGHEKMRYGNAFSCQNGDFQRRVQVHYYDREDAVPCEVHYFKDVEEPGLDQVLWRSANEAGFCEKQMALFVKDLSGQGWDCQSEGDMPPDLQFASPEK